jgi:hypothetical protein
MLNEHRVNAKPRGFVQLGARARCTLGCTPRQCEGSAAAAARRGPRHLVAAAAGFPATLRLPAPWPTMSPAERREFERSVLANIARIFTRSLIIAARAW